MSNSEFKIVKGRQQLSERERQQDDDQAFLFKQNNASSSIQPPPQTKGNNLAQKILILLAFVGVFYIANAVFLKQTNFYGDWRDKIKEVQFCSNSTYLFDNQCLQSCPNKFVKDVKSSLCISDQLELNQINISTFSNQYGRKLNVQLDILSKDFINNKINEDINEFSAGIIFFNDFTNSDYSFLLHQIEMKNLQRFLSNLNGVIVTFSGADSFYIENEKLINDQILKVQAKYPQITNWYTLGFGFSGSFNALKFFNKNLEIFSGTFLQDPVENLKDFKELKGLEEYMKHSIDDSVELMITNSLFKNLSWLSKKNIFIFKNRYYSSITTPSLSRLHPPNYQQYSYFDNNNVNFKTKAKYLTNNIFSIIEQHLNIPKRELFNHIN